MVSIYSFIWTLINCAIMAGVIFFLRKRTKFLEKYGIKSLIILSMLCVIRFLLPLEFPNYQFSIDDPYCYVWIDSILRNFHFVSQILYILLGIWFIRAFVCLYQLLKGWKTTMQELEEPAVSDEYSTAILLSEIDSNCKINICRSSATSVPVIVGLKHPVIYLPLEPYSDQELKNIILHEYTHYKRKDLWKKFFFNVFCAIFWWNPCIDLVRKEYFQLIELNCDKSVSKYFNDKERDEYLLTLIDAMKAINDSKEKYSLYMIEFVSIRKASAFKQRVDLLMERDKYKKGRIIRQIIFIAIAVVWMILSYYFLLQPKYTVSSKELWFKTTTSVANKNNAYLEEQKDGSYLFYFEDFVINVSKEEKESGIYKEFPIIRYKGSDDNWLSKVLNWIDFIS